MDYMNNSSSGSNNIPFPLVSAVITTHNRPELLKTAIQSVLDQTYKNIELIVVDDNSVRNTADYLQGLKKKIPAMKYIYIGENESRGGNYARNLGIKNAEGKYIAFLDDDDLWLPEKIEKQLQFFDERTGMVYCGQYNEYIDGIHKNWFREAVVDSYYTGDLSQKCFRRICCTTSAIMAETSLVREVNGFDENLGFWQETDFFISMSQITRVAAVTEPLAVVRINLSDTGRLSNKYYGWIEAVNYIDNKYKKNISVLPDEYKLDRRVLILRDKSVRCEKCGLEDEKRKTLREVWNITHSPKDFIKFIFNRALIRMPSFFNCHKPY